MKIAHRTSNVLSLTAGRIAGPVAPEDPLLIVGPSVTAVDILDVGGFARQRIARMATVEDVTNIDAREVIVDGTTTSELTADARHAATETPLRLYQVLIPDGGFYYLIQGRVGAAEADDYLPEFRQVTKSFRRIR